MQREGGRDRGVDLALLERLPPPPGSSGAAGGGQSPRFFS